MVARFRVRFCVSMVVVMLLPSFQKITGLAVGVVRVRFRVRVRVSVRGFIAVMPCLRRSQSGCGGGGDAWC